MNWTPGRSSSHVLMRVVKCSHAHRKTILPPALQHHWHTNLETLRAKTKSCTASAELERNTRGELGTEGKTLVSWILCKKQKHCALTPQQWRHYSEILLQVSTEWSSCEFCRQILEATQAGGTPPSLILSILTFFIRADAFHYYKVHNFAFIFPCVLYSEIAFFLFGNKTKKYSLTYYVWRKAEFGQTTSCLSLLR